MSLLKIHFIIFKVFLNLFEIEMIKSIKQRTEKVHIADEFVGWFFNVATIDLLAQISSLFGGCKCI